MTHHYLPDPVLRVITLFCHPLTAHYFRSACKHHHRAISALDTHDALFAHHYFEDSALDCWLWAARQGNVRDLRRLLSIHPTYLQDNPGRKHMALMEATQHNHIQAVTFLLDNATPPVMPDTPEFVYATFNPLYVASKYGHTELIHLLLDRGTCPVDRRHWLYPISLAAENGHLEAVQCFLSANQSDQATLTRVAGAGMKGAIEGGHNRIMEELINIGVLDMNSIYQFAHHAVRNRNPVALGLLLANGARVNQWLLDECVMHNVGEMVRMVLEAGDGWDPKWLSQACKTAEGLGRAEVLEVVRSYMQERGIVEVS
ncbi:hypothetical protein HDV00_008788 [Rhizophlyctis rosea]|nr:hypothetical protein HDV00_008788 [Rhizophlyctis rosea]